MKKASFAVRHDTAETLRALVMYTGISEGEHIRRAVTAELLRVARPLPRLGTFKLAYTVKLSVALPPQTLGLLQAWQHQTVSDHLRRALEAYLPDAVFAFAMECVAAEKWLKLQFPEELEWLRPSLNARIADNYKALRAAGVPEVDSATGMARAVQPEAQQEAAPPPPRVPDWHGRPQTPGVNRPVPMYEAPKPGDPRPPKPAVPPNLPPEVKFDK